MVRGSWSSARVVSLTDCSSRLVLKVRHWLLASIGSAPRVSLCSSLLFFETLLQVASSLSAVIERVALKVISPPLASGRRLH